MSGGAVIDAGAGAFEDDEFNVEATAVSSNAGVD
jgi:hypothetical protein